MINKYVQIWNIYFTRIFIYFNQAKYLQTFSINLYINLLEISKWKENKTGLTYLFEKIVSLFVWTLLVVLTDSLV